MAISATERDELRGLARGALGDRGADLLMAGLATADLPAMEERLTLRIDLARSELRSEFSEQMGHLRQEFGELRGDFGELRGYVGDQIGQLRGEIGELRGVVGEQIGAVRAEAATQNKILFFALVTAIIGIISLIVAVAVAVG